VTHALRVAYTFKTIMNWLPWAPLVAAILHMCEEFVYPGGFPDWYRRYRVNASRITSRFLVIINSLLLIACVDIGILGRTSAGVVYWLTISALLCCNGIWHAWASHRSRSYSPGVVTGVIIYLPLAVYGYSHFLRSQTVSVGTALIAILIGGSYQFWSALYHRSLRVLSQKRSP
jgi:hypothetical protein